MNGKSVEVELRNIRVNLLSPGWTMTDRQLRDHVTGETQQFLKAVQCLGEPLMSAEPWVGCGPGFSERTNLQW